MQSKASGKGYFTAGWGDKWHLENEPRGVHYEARFDEPRSGP